MSDELIEKIAREIDSNAYNMRGFKTYAHEWARVTEVVRGTLAILAKPENITDSTVMAANIAYYGAGGEHNGPAMRKAIAAAISSILNEK